MVKEPRVGMIVTLTDEGMTHVGGIRSRAEIQDFLRMRITGFDQLPMNEGEPDTYLLEFKDNLMGRFLITNWEVVEV